jgi:hypothetical protein
MVIRVEGFDFPRPDLDEWATINPQGGRVRT